MPKLTFFDYLKYVALSMFVILMLGLLLFIFRGSPVILLLLLVGFAAMLITGAIISRLPFKGLQFQKEPVGQIIAKIYLQKTENGESMPGVFDPFNKYMVTSPETKIATYAGQHHFCYVYKDQISGEENNIFWDLISKTVSLEIPGKVFPFEKRDATNEINLIAARIETGQISVRQLTPAVIREVIEKTQAPEEEQKSPQSE